VAALLTATALSLPSAAAGASTQVSTAVPYDLKFRTFALLQVSDLPFRRAATSFCPY
jgi:hypothetical protein